MGGKSDGWRALLEWEAGVDVHEKLEGEEGAGGD
jgi:hypothetical protein